MSCNAMLKQTTGPGYLYQISHGATSLTEAWDANPADSQNHAMLGHVEEWLYNGLGGINPDPGWPRFQEILHSPAASERAHLGRRRVPFRPRADRPATGSRAAPVLTLSVTIPVNTTATITIPTSNPAAVTESGIPAATARV